MLRPILILCLSLLLFPAAAQDTPSRAAIASAHPVATAAGFEVLEAGGNAFDAAVAVSATLAVVEPYSSGMGGGGFWLLQPAAAAAVMIDGRESAPAAAHRRMYQDADGEIVQGLSVDGPLAAAIPGQAAALAHIARDYGELPLARSLAPAIRAAREGFEVTPHYRRMAGFRLEALRASPAAAEVFLLDGEVPPLGHVVRQPDLAGTLEALGQEGAAGFYTGPVARKLVEGTRAAGGIWTRADLADYRVVEREPVAGEYQGHRIVSASPPSSGGVALITMLNILSELAPDAAPTGQREHAVIEAMRRAYRDRAEYLGDPDHVDVPVERLTHPFYAAGLAAGIRLDRATPSDTLAGIGAEPAGPHTSHFSILDRAGNRVAATLSINYPFGSGFVPPGTGVLLNDEMDDFSAKPGTPNVYGLVGAEANAIAPGKRPLSSMSPTIVESEERITILGTPGGSRIITMVLHGTLAAVDGADAGTVVSRPRYHHQYLPDEVEVERDALSDDVAEHLRGLGHRLRTVDPYGNMQAVIWDRRTGDVEAASDPRGEGEAGVR